MCEHLFVTLNKILLILSQTYFKTTLSIDFWPKIEFYHGPSASFGKGHKNTFLTFYLLVDVFVM